jgi:hypothetical protein
MQILIEGETLVQCFRAETKYLTILVILKKYLKFKIFQILKENFPLNLVELSVAFLLH